MQMVAEVQRLCYVLSEEHRDERGYMPLLVRENTPGFRVMDWRWGPSKAEAQKKADQVNQTLGLGADAVREIVASTVEA